MTDIIDTPLTGETVAIQRRFSTPGVHPYDQITWERRDVEQTNWKTGEVVFEQRGVEFPDFWSINASTIVTTKYFRGALGTDAREWSLRQVIDRVVRTYTEAGLAHGYFTEQDAQVFSDELTYLLVHQYFAFNSPVWFNVGTTAPQQVSACFILSVEDTMDSILNWYKEEGFIFKGGSGAGLNLSRIRSSKELLKSSGGTASGPVSFMRGADASAGTIKSGGATRRAAKMVVLDVDHPDIEEFVETKVREEDKIRVLRDAGYDMDLGGTDITSVQYQNANNSVRVSDAFMTAASRGQSFDLIARTDGSVIESVDAAGLMDKIAQAAWACADPGIQYDDTINAWHTNPQAGRINASNPCSEYMHLDNSSCNLASLNLMKFRTDDASFDIDAFVAAVNVIITAMDISVSFADFPTEAIGDTTRRYRQLGIGYANLGALLMSLGLPYDSAEGRALAGAITSLMTAAAYRQSAELAGVVGPYAGYEESASDHRDVMVKHREAGSDLVSAIAGYGTFVEDGLVSHQGLAGQVATEALNQWEDNLTIGDSNGWRNAQASVLAPTGTIGFMMDCDTTGIEPDFSLVKFKKLVGGGSMQIVNTGIPMALENLGYSPDAITSVSEYVAEHGNVVDAPHLNTEHYAIFDTAMGERSIAPMGHVRMMAACQPFLSGAISKTVNMPETATVEDVKEIYTRGWELGLKALAIYRDNCKVGQPLSDAKAKTTDASNDGETVPATPAGPVREKLPKSRASRTTSFTVAGAEGYLTAGSYDDGRLGEMFVKLGKQGSTLAGVMDAFSIATSIALQYGVPLEAFVSKFVNTRFEPSGMTDDPDIRISSSMMDYLFRRLALDHLDYDTRAALGIFTAEERAAAVEENYASTTATETATESAESTPQAPSPTVDRSAAHSSAELMELITGKTADAPLCLDCGIKMRPSGSCFICEACASTSGCS